MPTRRNPLTKRHSCPATNELQLLREELRQEKLAREATERENRVLRSEVARLSEKLECVLRGQSQVEEFLQKEIRKRDKLILELEAKLEGANKQLAWFRKNYFARTSEQAPLEGNEAEHSEVATVDQDQREAPEEPAAKEQPKTKRSRGQQKGSKGHGRSDRSELPRHTENLTKQCACNTCGKAYRCISRTENSPLIEMVTMLLLTEYKRFIYVPDCKCEGGKIITADPPPKLYDRAELGNSVWVYLVVQKFLFGVPTHRTLNDFRLKGLPLAQGTVTGGFQRIDALIDPLYERLLDHCRGGQYWNADETTWRMFGSGKRRWWMWLISCEDTVAYLLDPSRSKAVPTEFFEGSEGTLMTDRLSSYKGLHDGIKKAWCWVHMRRDFLKVFHGIKKLKCWAQMWLEEIAKLFVLTEHRFCLWAAGANYGAPWVRAQAALVEHVQKMETRWQDELPVALHKEQQKVLLSLKRHWDGLTLFVLDPRVPLHNNRAERLLRNVVILRKNSFGSGAEWSGRFAAKMFSLLQTWLVNGLDPEALLLDFFDRASEHGRPPPNPDDYLPWSMSKERKELFRLPKSFKRPG